jgi:hypothetical protein
MPVILRMLLRRVIATTVIAPWPRLPLDVEIGPRSSSPVSFSIDSGGRSDRDWKSFGISVGFSPRSKGRTSATWAWNSAGSSS